MYQTPTPVPRRKPQDRGEAMKFAWMLVLTVASAGMGAAQDDARGPLQLSLKRAVEIATQPEGNSNIQLSGEALKQAQMRSAEARAALLPDVEASIGERSATTNLGALGINVVVPIPGFHFPTFVGPYTTMDARVTGTQSVFDFSSIRRFQASKLGVSAARSDADSTGDRVAADVARAYLWAVKTDADVDA